MQFRKDINGLRALAVIAVVLFHFNASWMPGGFAGVDVFFVISGFLMTGIIFRGIEQQKFSILTFYIARANRIIPALAVLCIALLLFGWFFLTPSDYRMLGKHVVSSIGFFSNIIYWREAGYFDASSHEKWLLHSWSLSVEWQFYMIYPILLVALRRYISVKTLKAAVLFGAVTCFVISVASSYIWPNSAYYLLHTRIWEMMIGGVAYLYPLDLRSNTKKIFEWTGLLFIAGSYLLISEHTLWPGYLAFFPVFGAFLIIQAQRNDSIISNNIICQRLGAWSYSIYLWHWPFVVAIHYFSLSSFYIYPFMALSVICGYISATYVEKISFRKHYHQLLDYLRCIPAYIAVIVCFLGGLTFITNGFESHYSSDVLVADREQRNKNPRIGECHVSGQSVPECIYGEGTLGAIVIGDSHAQSVVRSVEKSLPGNASVMDWTMSGCRTIEGLYNTRPKGIPDHSCGEFISYALKKIKNYPDIPIVIANRYSALLWGPNEPALAHRTLKADEFISDNQAATRDAIYFEAMNNKFFDTVCAFSADNPVVLLGQIPEMKVNVPKVTAIKLLQGHDNVRVTIPVDEYVTRNTMFEKVAARLVKQCNVTYIPLNDQFCDDQFCYGDIDRRPVYFDSNHLSEYGASHLIPALKEVIISNTK